MILGVFSELIHHYHIKVSTPDSSASSNNRSNLLSWFRTILPETQVANLASSWNDGLALSALVDYCKPGLIPDHASLDPSNGLENIKNAMDIAEKELGVPQVVCPVDMATDKPDEFMVMTYLSYFCNPGSVGQKRLLQWVNAFLPSKHINDFGSNWEDGRLLYELVQTIAPRAATPLDMLDEQSPAELKQAAKEIAEKEFQISSTKGLENITGSNQLPLLVFLAQLQSKVKIPSLSTNLSAEGSGITGTDVNVGALVSIIGEIPSSDNLTIVVTSPNGSNVSIEDSSSEPASPSYHYMPTVHGEYVVDITYYGSPIAGSPYHVMHIDEALAENCKIVRQVTRTCINTPTKFTVDCSEAGPGKVVAIIEKQDGEQVPVTVTPKEGDQHLVQFTPDNTGPLSIYISWNGSAIPHSPFSCQVLDPSRCEAKGIGLSNSILGHPAQFHVYTNGAGEGHPSATVSGPSEPVDLTLVSSTEGVYTYEYTPHQEGSYHIDIKFARFPIHGSPFIVRPEHPTVASSCSVREFPHNRMTASKPISVTVNMASSNDEAELTGTFLLEDSEEEAQCQVSRVGEEESIYAVSFVPKEVGVYTVHIYYGGLEIPECPLNFMVNDPTKCIVDFDPGQLYHIDQPVTMHVGTDAAGKGDLTATGKGPTGEDFMCNIAEDGEGVNTHVVSFVPKKGGKHLITLLFDNQLLLDTPITIPVESNTLDNIVLSKPVSQHGYLLINEPLNMKMFAPSRDEQAFAATSLGVNTGAIPTISIEATGEDDYNISFKAAYPDNYKVQITYNGRQIPGSPFTLAVNQSPSADQVVSFDPVIPLKAGKPIEFTFDASLAGGVGSGTLTANIASSTTDWIIPSVEEIAQGLYCVGFIPPREDKYTVTIFWYGKQVKDSPFVIDFKQQVSQPKVTVEYEPEESNRRLLSATAVGQKTRTKAKVNVQQFERGKYQISLSPAKEDVYNLHVYWFSSEIKGSPFTVDLTQSKGASPSRESKVLSAYVKGKHSGLKKINLSVNEKKDLATVSFDDRRGDVYDLYVYWNQRLVKGAPFEIDVSN